MSEMSDKEKIKSLLKEASLYSNQGLFVEAKQKYLKILETIKKSENYRGDTKLLGALQTKIKELEKKREETLQDDIPPALTPEVQKLILELFAFSKNKDMASIEGAVALAKFGQYEKAIDEFKRFMKEGTMPLVAAKNILRCHQNLSSINGAITEFEQWVSERALSPDQLMNLRAFLLEILDKEGIQADLPQIAVAAPEEEKRPTKAPKAPIDEEDIIDINLVSMKLHEGPRKGELVEFDVTFQAGNTVSFTVPSDDEDLLDALKPGKRLTQMQCYSMLAVFNGSGVVSGKTRITSGPKRGDYTLDVTIDGG
jgi:tetratricopeptide (TPR) repeat protein